jgi:hypothetical protein
MSTQRPHNSRHTPVPGVEVACLPPPRFHSRFLPGHHSPRQHRGAPGGGKRRHQLCGPLSPLRPRAATQPHPRLSQALGLTRERHGRDTLITQPPDEHPDSGKPLLADRGRRRGTAHHCGLLAVDHRAPVCEKDRGAGALRSARGDLRAAPLIRRGGESCHCRLGQDDCWPGDGALNPPLALIRHLSTREPHAALRGGDGCRGRRRLISGCAGRREPPRQSEVVRIGRA